MADFKSDVRDGMRIDWDVPITMDDGLVLRADVYRPVDDARYPVILTYGPYGKWLHFEDLYTDQWRRMVDEHPDVPAGSTNKFQNWEVVDPEKWVPDGYAVVRVDSRRRRSAHRGCRMLRRPAGSRGSSSTLVHPHGKSRSSRGCATSAGSRARTS